VRVTGPDCSPGSVPFCNCATTDGEAGGAAAVACGPKDLGSPPTWDLRGVAGFRLTNGSLFVVEQEFRGHLCT
jgi:hypothetical protein